MMITCWELPASDLLQISLAAEGVLDVSLFTAVPINPVFRASSPLCHPLYGVSFIQDLTMINSIPSILLTFYTGTPNLTLILAIVTIGFTYSKFTLWITISFEDLKLRVVII